MDRALASSGLLVVAVDMTVAPEAPYPACVQDANYTVRWLKVNAATWNGDTAKIGIYGSSSGGHVAELIAMRPRDPRYNAVPLALRKIRYAMTSSSLGAPANMQLIERRIMPTICVVNHVFASRGQAECAAPG